MYCHETVLVWRVNNSCSVTGKKTKRSHKVYIFPFKLIILLSYLNKFVHDVTNLEQCVLCFPREYSLSLAMVKSTSDLYGKQIWIELYMEEKKSLVQTNNLIHVSYCSNLFSILISPPFSAFKVLTKEDSYSF